MYFVAYSIDKITYALILGYVQEIPSDLRELLRNGEEVTFDDAERILKE
ncbi:hypothetical protein [Staphylothermus marinus]|nr:hypothetical protein [Staphylothermus marinus]